MVKQLINVIIAGTVVVIMYNFLSHQDILIGDMLQKESVKGAYLTGAGFLDVNIKLWIYRIISIVIIIAVYNFIRGIKKEESKKILFSIILIPAALIIVFIVNIAIDSIFLRGNDIDREKEYILQNIRATEEAYNINVENKEIAKGTDITSEKIKKDSELIEKLPMVTPDVVKETLENNTDNKEKKSLYKYGNPNLVKNGNAYDYLTTREIDDKDKTLTNKIYKYTHGNFGILTSSSKVNKNGYLLNVSEKFEGQELNGTKIKEPRLYYGENTNSNAIVNAKDIKEYDYPTSTLTNKENNYNGKGGIKLSLLERIALAITKGSTELIFNNNIVENTKVLLNRQIIERAKKILPNIRYDKDPYLVTKDDGGLAWVIDGYTVTSRYPYSQKVSIEADKGGKERINFIRNSVKVVIDAYNGTVDFYVTDTTDPFISTIMKTYPTLFKNYNELSENIKKQMKYPQYLFDIQAKVLTTYHNSDVDNIYRADDRWEVAEVSGSGTRSSTSMYTLLKKGDELKPAIITTYTPEKRKNIVSYLVGQTENGANKLTMLRILMIPVFIAVLVYSKDRDIVYRYIALGIFIIASATDALDGYVARKYNMITDFGKLMDPLADKILVSSALIILIELGNISSWVVSIVIAREFIISGIRLIATEKNIIIAASPLGKLKTVSQMLSVILMLLSIEAISFITDISVWLMCILSVVSLLDYIIKNKKVLSLGGM